MLPEQYCNYLLTLYSQGEVQPERSPKKKSEKELFYGLAMGTLFLINIFLNYFTEISNTMQIVVTTFSILAFVFLIRQCMNKKILFQLSLIGLSLLMLVETVKWTEIIATEKRWFLFTCLFLNCGLWILIGRKYRLLYFSIAGFMGLVVISYFLLI